MSAAQPYYDVVDLEPGHPFATASDWPR